MDIISKLRKLAETDGQRAAVIGEGGHVLTYSQLNEYSDRLAIWLHRLNGQKSDANQSARPIAVYGHKNPLMLVCFLGAAKSGRAYCPLDISMPEGRVRDTIQALDPEVILDLENDIDTLINIINDPQNTEAEYNPSWAVAGSQTFYIIFTSGSTGKPKGVKISADCLNNYLDWSCELGSAAEEKHGKIFLNQAPFSFDLSVMDTYTCLACGGTLALMEKRVQNDFALMIDFFKKTPLNIWVSTPSFADMCMGEPSFNSNLLPNLGIFLFCGEELTINTYEKLRQRFPDSRIINLYGPTESTVAVTSIEITEEIYKKTIAEGRKLPAGTAKNGTIIEINENTENNDSGDRLGEIIITGNTVSTGYFNNPEKTAEAFFEKDIKNGDGSVSTTRAYRTGDLGYIADGLLYCVGRIDFQIKMHGYRIELGDIEQNLADLPEISRAVVVPVEKEGHIKSLTAYVITDTEVNPQHSEKNSKNNADISGINEKSLENKNDTDSEFQDLKINYDRQFSRRIKEQLLIKLPDYMIPKKIIMIDRLPMNSNGKINRNQLRSIKS